MIYVDLEDWEDIMEKVQEDPAFDTVYNFHLGGQISSWSLRIWAFNKWICYRYYTGAGQLLINLGVIKDLEEVWPTGPVASATAYENRERDLAEVWRGPTLKALEDLDLVTLGSRGSIYIPGEALEY